MVVSITWADGTDVALSDPYDWGTIGNGTAPDATAPSTGLGDH